MSARPAETAEAPFFADLAAGPPGGRAVWVRAADGVRLRVAFWPREAARGSVLLLQGRTECIEKYGPVAAGLAARGLASFAPDLRGQGLSDRLVPDPMMGHVGSFADYQLDLRATLAAAEAAGMPRPWFLLAHSMGGAVGLRAILQGVRFSAAAFSAPMWGIAMSAMMAPVARVIGRAARAARLGARYAPSTGPVTYVTTAPFEGNTLTRDRPMWDFMARQLTAQPGLALGGPSLHWLDEALAECRWLMRQPPPALPAFAALGGNERIVASRAVVDYMTRWKGAELRLFPGAEHEILMELPAVRDAFLDLAAERFRAAA